MPPRGLTGKIADEKVAKRLSTVGGVGEIMRDKDLYQQILGLSTPWFVADVELCQEEQRVVVHVGRTRSSALECPECSKEMVGYDSRERRWRHLDTCQYTTILVADVPRGRCVDHGVRQIRVPWAEPGSQFTALFERLVIDWLKEASQTAVARTLGLSWDEVHGVMGRGAASSAARFVMRTSSGSTRSPSASGTST